MALKMRLYHRRSSASRERMANCQLLGPSSSSLPRIKTTGLGNMGSRASTGSLSIPTTGRARSMSLLPGGDTSDCSSGGRIRSLSFSGIQGARPSAISESPRVLTASQEDDIFRCYTRKMYMMLIVLATAISGLVLYALYHTGGFKSN